MQVAETVNAGRQKLGRDDALRLARAADVVIAARGKNVVRFDMSKDRPGDAELLAVMLGPTGNLRAPTIRRGRTLIVGFNEGIYDKLVAGR
ncbi:MAG: hypothetical protein L6Q92_08425 [Phycisphaerae bacterium]|nr:hypothetical protein [Phycisphaerae bacterium]